MEKLQFVAESGLIAVWLGLSRVGWRDFVDFLARAILFIDDNGAAFDGFVDAFLGFREGLAVLFKSFMRSNDSTARSLAIKRVLDVDDRHAIFVRHVLQVLQSFFFADLECFNFICECFEIIRREDVAANVFAMKFHSADMERLAMGQADQQARWYVVNKWLLKTSA